MISVVIPTYNCAGYLPGCLESVFRQTLPPAEVIVVDDGSTENTHEVLKPWFDRIRYVRQQRAGAAAARNAGIRLSSSQYIALLDADDEWDDRKLQLQSEMLQRHPNAGLVCSDFSIAFPNGSRVPSQFAQNGGYRTGDVFVPILTNCFILTSTILLRRDVLRSAGEFDVTLNTCEDFNLWLRIAFHSDVLVVPEVLCHKRERKTRPPEETLRNQLASVRKLHAQLPSMSDVRRRAVDSEIARLEKIFGKFLLLQDKPIEARSHFRAALAAEWSAPAAALLGLAYLPVFAIRDAVRLRRRLRSATAISPSAL
jgi:glycosyltransferase involved in cell wall biosynthesis